MTRSRPRKERCRPSASDSCVLAGRTCWGTTGPVAAAIGALSPPQTAAPTAQPAAHRYGSDCDVVGSQDEAGNRRQGCSVITLNVRRKRDRVPGQADAVSMLLWLAVQLASAAELQVVLLHDLAGVPRGPVAHHRLHPLPHDQHQGSRKQPLDRG